MNRIVWYVTLRTEDGPIFAGEAEPPLKLYGNQTLAQDVADALNTAWHAEQMQRYVALLSMWERRRDEWNLLVEHGYRNGPWAEPNPPIHPNLMLLPYVAREIEVEG